LLPLPPPPFLFLESPAFPLPPRTGDGLRLFCYCLCTMYCISSSQRSPSKKIVLWALINYPIQSLALRSFLCSATRQQRRR
jgi:hypothetical protein